MMLDLPRLRHVKLGRYAIHGLAIDKSDGSTTYRIPFRESRGIQAVAISDTLVLAANIRSGTERDLALIDVTSGKVIKRAKVSNGSLTLDAARRHVVLFGSYPFIEVLDARSLQLVARFDRLTARDGKFEAKPAYTPEELAVARAQNEAKRLSGEQVADPFSVITFVGDAYEEPDGAFFTCLKENCREGSQNVATFYPARVSITTGKIDTLAAFPIPYRGAVPENSPRPELRPDGSASIAYHKGDSTPLLLRRIDHPVPVPEIINRERSPFPVDDPRFDAYAGRNALSKVELDEWTAASCGPALQRLAQDFSDTPRNFVWGERLEFAFIVGGVRVNEDDFFEGLVSRGIQCVDALRALLLAYLNKEGFLARNVGRELRTHDDIPAFGPAMKALVCLSSAELPVLNRFMRLQDVAHNTFLGLRLLPAFVKRHGWPTLDHMSMGLDYLFDSDARAPKDMPDLDLFRHAAQRMSADEFAGFILQQEAVRRELASGMSDGLLESFFSRFDTTQQFTSEVIASLEKLLKRRVTWS